MSSTAGNRAHSNEHPQALAGLTKLTLKDSPFLNRVSEPCRLLLAEGLGKNSFPPADLEVIVVAALDATLGQASLRQLGQARLEPTLQVAIVADVLTEHALEVYQSQLHHKE